MTLTTIGDLFSIGTVGRPRIFEFDDKIVHVGFKAEWNGNFYGERMFFSVLDKSGAVLTPLTSLGEHLDFATYPNGFGQNVFHVSENSNGKLVFHTSEFTNGYVDNGVFVPYEEHRSTIVQNSNGSLGTPTERADGYMTYEISDSVDLSNDNIALIYENAQTHTAQLQIMSSNGTILSTQEIDGTFDEVGIFAQGTRGLEIIQVGAQILTLHRNPADNVLYGQFFSLNGTPSAAGEFQISTGVHGGASNAAVWEDGVIDAAILADGRVAIVWADSATGTDGTEAWLTILNADGSVSVAETMASINHSAGEQFHPRVHALDSGGLIVTFDQNFAPATDPRGFLQEFDANGVPIGDPLELGEGVAGNGGTGYGHIFPDGTGFMIDWYGNVQQISTDSGGATSIDGTSGRDILNGTAGDDEINGLAGNDVLRGRAGDDDMSGGAGKDRMNGQNGRDSLFGDAGADRLDGGSGRDVLRGGTGNDRLDGGNGRDVLRGGAGGDRLDGGGGNDLLIGDGGADSFVFKANGGQDRIVGFQDDVDRLLLDADLWGGGLSKQQFLDQFASVVGSDILLDFGQHELTIKGIADISALKDDLVFI